MTEPQFDPQRWARERYGQTTQALAWERASLPAMRGWQRRLRGRLRALAGVPQDPRRPPEAELVEMRDFGAYRRETVRFESRPGLKAFGYFLVPRDAPLHGPAVLCLPGHGRGVNAIVGIREDGTQRELGEPEEYAADFALQCVARGFSAFALEQISFGGRRDMHAISNGESSSCHRDSVAALMLGETMTGWRVWDALRALTYLRCRREVNPHRIAVMGISGGGLTALWTAALDTGVRAAVVSGYFNTYRDSILAIDHCVDNYVPGLLGVVEMPDLSGLIAPRALFVENGLHDPIFPVQAFERAVFRAEEIYRAFDVPEQFGAEAFDGDHRFSGLIAFDFLKSRL